jgi:Phosphotransferase enzyme family
LVDQPSDLLWLQTAWLEKASSWIERELHRQGIKRIEPIEQPHIRSWSTVLRIPTNLGDIYFKAVVPALAYESALTQMLSHRYPHCVPHILASNREHGWLLMSDGGNRLRERLKTEDDIQHWQVVLPIYAALQKKSVPHLDELLELGLPDRRLAILPTKFQELLTNTEALALNRPGGLNAVECQQLQDSVDLCAKLCEQLAAFGIPETLDHGDLHDGNVFIREGQYLLFDWGDSSAAHPFFTIRNTYDSLGQRFGVEKSSSWFQRLRDGYLALWTEYEPREKLEEAFALAQQLSSIPSALRWLPVLANMDAATRNKYIEAIPNLLRVFLSTIKAYEDKF